MHRLRPGDRRRRRAALSDPKETVRAGYDAIAETYSEWARTVVSPALERVRRLSDELPERSQVLELGCGRGVPFTRALSRRHDVTGVDISARQIELARADVPEATFVRSDAVDLEFPDRTFDAVVSLFMFGHLPSAEQPRLLERILAWLRPGGTFLSTFGGGDPGEGFEDDWLGAPTFFASLGEETYRRLLPDLGFDVVDADVVPQLEHGREVRFLWVLARRPG